MKQLNIDDFRRYLRIDKTALDDELVQQPSLLFEVSEAYVQAVSERDGCKEQLALVDAQLDNEVRLKLDRDDTRITEGLVKSMVQTNRKHETAFKAFADAKTRADVLSALKDSFHQRGYMLRDLCSLHVANYYEQNSARGTDRTDTAVYHQQRSRLAAERDKRG